MRHFSLVLSLIAATCLTACNTTSGEAPGSGGRGGRGRGGRGGAAISIDTTTLQRISIQRQVDLSGTLLSPDQASVIPVYLRGRGLQMIAKRVRAGRNETGMLAQVQWLSANASAVADALAAAVP